LAVLKYHFDQEINMPWLVSISRKAGENFFGSLFELDFSNGEFHEEDHLYLHIRKKDFLP